MAWTDLSNSASDTWGIAAFLEETSTGVATLPDGEQVLGSDVSFNENNSSYPYSIAINSLNLSYNLPGFDIGYQPDSTPSPIVGNLDTPSTGGTWPTSRFLYPRGY